MWPDCALVHSSLKVDLSFLHMCVTVLSPGIEVTHEVVHLLGGKLSTPGGQGLCLSRLYIPVAQLCTE